jgi:orotate phosphoribosyltransferase
VAARDTSPAGGRARLLELMKVLSWKRGIVTLQSGKTSDFYIDTKQTSLNAEGSLVLGELIFAHVRALREQGTKVLGVGGLTLGADPLASACAVVSAQKGDPVHAFIIRKEPKAHGTQEWVEGQNNLPAGSPVLVLEDVVTTGASTLKAIERARHGGLVPVAVLAVVDRDEGGRENIVASGLPFAALLTKADFV